MIITHPHFRQIKTKHAKEVLEILLNNQDAFSILSNLEDISFNPILPQHISSNFSEVILFTLANYTLQSAYIDKESLIFEAGFGEENFGSVVTVPLDSIIQITQDETPLFVNVSATLPKEEKPKNPFEANPRNKKFLK